MTIYTFYMCNPDGSANSLEAFDLGSDEMAEARAMVMLAQHQSCAYVSVFQGDRPVLARYRAPHKTGVSLDRAEPNKA
jgi:hypothetical protein